LTKSWIAERLTEA
jgi:hypothetical protein